MRFKFGQNKQATGSSMFLGRSQRFLCCSISFTEGSPATDLGVYYMCSDKDNNNNKYSISRG